MKPLLCIALFAVSSYSAPPTLQSRTPASGSQKESGGSNFLSKAQLLALAINSAAMTADIVTSKQAIARGGHEANPIMGPNTALLFKVGEVALVTAVSYELYRHHHQRLARVLPLLTAAPSIFAAGHNSNVR